MPCVEKPWPFELWRRCFRTNDKWSYSALRVRMSDGWPRKAQELHTRFDMKGKGES